MRPEHTIKFRGRFSICDCRCWNAECRAGTFEFCTRGAGGLSEVARPTLYPGCKFLFREFTGCKLFDGIRKTVTVGIEIYPVTSQKEKAGKRACTLIAIDEGRFFTMLNV